MVVGIVDVDVVVVGIVVGRVWEATATPAALAIPGNIAGCLVPCGTTCDGYLTRLTARDENR
jgi:hypothetical protein